MIEVYYNPEELEKTKIHVENDDVEDLLYDIATLIDGIINVAVIKNVVYEKQEITSVMVKQALVALLSSREGTEIESFREVMGITE